MDTTIRMSEVLNKIFNLKRDYAKLPLFEFLRDERIDATDRIAFYPGMAHFILSFGDLNKYVLRKEPAADEYQALINAHTYEDDHHWQWYLEDFKKLGFNRAATPTQLMEILWGDATSRNRVLMYKLTAMIDRASSVERIAIVEAIEETGNVLFKEVLNIAKILEQRFDVELRYCGLHHFNLESGHAMGSDHRDMAAIELDSATFERCSRFVDEVFEVFTQWTHELLHFAKQNAKPAAREKASVTPIARQAT